MSDFPLLGPWETDNPYRGALVIPVAPDGRVLLQLRDHGPDTVHPGKWSLFGGGAEPGEDLALAAARELEEETGLTVAPAALTPVARILSSPGRRRLWVFEAQVEAAPFDVRLGEGAGFAFARARDFEGYDLIPFAREVLISWRDR